MVKYRGEVLDVNEKVDLTIQFKDFTGTPVDADSFPQITIVQPSGLILLPSTSVGVTRVDTGKYSYVFTVPYNGPYGVFNDIWVGYVNGYRAESTLSFVVTPTQVPSINSDGYLSLGDDPGFHYSQEAIKNINLLLKILKQRLNSSGKAIAKDSYGNNIYVDCDIFSIDTLVSFLAAALWDFNQVPFFTDFEFDDTSFVRQFGEILIEGATLYSLASKALIERGREYQISDNGINFTPPTVSEMLNTQYNTLFSAYNDKLKVIKNSLRPAPLGLGTLSMNSSSMNPAVNRLRHLRSRRFF